MSKGTARCPDWRHPRLPYTWDRYAGKDRAPEWSHMEPGVLMAVVGAKSTRSRPLCVAVGCSIHASEPGPINRYVTPQSTRWLLRKPVLCEPQRAAQIEGIRPRNSSKATEEDGQMKMARFAAKLS